MTQRNEKGSSRSLRRVAIAGVGDLDRSHRWRAAAGDLAIEAAGELVGRTEIDSLFVAAPAALAVEAQAAAGAVLADRLGLAGRVAVHQSEAGDASGAAALHAAWAHVAAGRSRAALVLGVAKVTDFSESERGELLDTLIDREVEGQLGLGYMPLAGMLADLYQQRHDLGSAVFAHVVAKNAANACQGGETFLPYAASAAEIARDIPMAAPLVRSDFAPLLDGATALLVSDLELAREIEPEPVEILALAGASDWTVVAERDDPLRLRAAERAIAAVLDEAGIGSAGDLSCLEVHNACSLLEVLALESAAVTEPGTTCRRYKEGFGRLGSELPINPGGGQQGRGLTFGVSGLEQAREAFLQLRGAAGDRQVAAAAEPGGRVLALSIAGLGNQAFATVFGRPEKEPAR